MFESNLLFWQKITAVVFLVLFFVGRFAWSKFKGKRERGDVSSNIISGRFIIQFFVYGLIPLLLILNSFEINNISLITSKGVVWLYCVGLTLSLVGAVLMFLARFHRQTDWGFMGDNVGETLFTKGVYGITRHPYYIGAILLGLGVYTMLNSLFVLVMIPVILFVAKVIKREDLYLHEKFKEEWIKYKNKVGIIPFA